MEVSGQVHTMVALPQYMPPGNHFKGGWVGPIAGLDGSSEASFLCPCWEINSDCPVKRVTLSL
jgi:hypothetical protein